MTKHIRKWFMQGDRREENRVIEKLTLAGLVLTMVIQVGACIWWASKLTTIVDYNRDWIIEHKTETQKVQVLEGKIYYLEENVSRLIIKLDKIFEGYQVNEKDNSKKK